MPERLECEVLQKARYINTLTYLPTYLPFNATPTMEIALRKSHVNGATKLKLYNYIGIGKYLGVSKFFR